MLRDVERVGDDLVVHFSGPLDAAGTADLIAGRDMICVRGNHDRWLFERARDETGPSGCPGYEDDEWARALVTGWLR